jgi:hypothetical protein
MRRAVIALVVLLLAVALSSAERVEAFPHDVCRGARDCSGGGPQFCLADTLTSTTGRCVAGRVLP